MLLVKPVDEGREFCLRATLLLVSLRTPTGAARALTSKLVFGLLLHGYFFVAVLVGTGGFEPPTSSVSGRRSTPELRAFRDNHRRVTRPCNNRQSGSQYGRLLLPL